MRNQNENKSGSVTNATVRKNLQLFKDIQSWHSALALLRSLQDEVETWRKQSGTFLNQGSFFHVPTAKLPGLLLDLKRIVRFVEKEAPPSAPSATDGPSTSNDVAPKYLSRAWTALEKELSPDHPKFARLVMEIAKCLQIQGTSTSRKSLRRGSFSSPPTTQRS